MSIDVIATCVLAFLFADRPDNGESAAQRVIAIAPSSAEIICAVGACDRIVGVSKFCVYPPELKSRPDIGGFSDPDLERITALRPDLIVMRGRNDSLERLAERLKVTIYYDESDSFDGIGKAVLEIGGILGKSGDASRVIDEFRSEIDRIRARVAGRPKPRVLITVSRQPDRLANLLTAGKGTFLDEMIDAAGGINVFGTVDMRYPQISPESIIAQQPEVILELMPGLTADPAMQEEIKSQWNSLPSVPAVARDRIHLLNADNVLIPSPRFTEVIQHVSRILHPE